MKLWHLTIANAVFLLSAGIGAAQDMPTPEEAHCIALRGMLISPEKIAEPARRGVVYSADLVKGDQSAGGGFCKVLGGIEPIDPKAPNINFQINLPLTWNDKIIQYGGGGYDGTLIEAVKNVSFGSDAVKTPLQRGYVTFGSDSGHQSPSVLDGKFLLNDEALANFGGLQIKKTHDVTMAVVEGYYGRKPRKSYIQGNSQGGHESLIAIQRWPADYDGAIVTHPANPFSALQLSGNYLAKAFYKSGAYLSPAKVELLNTAVAKACDKLDGVEDGLISNTAACDATFKVEDLRCASGKDEGNACLSDAQIAVLKTINTPYKSPVRL
jgi:feruloyl esterase